MKISPELLEEIQLSEFIAVDIETTGLDYLKDEIIELSVVRFRYGQPSETLTHLLRPGKPVPEQITQITGIRDDDVQEAPRLEEVAEEFLTFLGDAPLVAHNVPFDLPFLEYHLRRVRKMEGVGEPVRQYLVLPNHKHDTLLLSRTLLPFLSGFSLGKMAAHFDIALDGAHRAEADARAAGYLLMHLLETALQIDFQDLRTILNVLAPTQEPIKTFFENLHMLLATGKYQFPRLPGGDTFYQSANFYNIIGEGETPQEGTLETRPIDEVEVRSAFEEGGLLHGNFGPFELRASQIEMAGEVANAFNQQAFLAVEASTGTGKSMAYLLPAVKWSVQNYGPFGRVIISTNTKNLQEQLFLKDIPILHSLLKEKFKAVLLKGKANYLCLDKWVTVLKNMKFRLNAYERSRILPLILWAKNTETGDISENTAFSVKRNMSLWSKFIAEDNYCPGRSCKYYNQCYLWRARNNARDANLVLVNHSLLFSDLAAEQAILSEYTNLIIDEAHNIEKVATEYLGTSLSIWAFYDPLKKLYSQDRFATGMLIQIKKRLQLSEVEESKKNLLMHRVEAMLPEVDEAIRKTRGFFQELIGCLREFVPDTSNTRFNTRFRYRRDDGIHRKMAPYQSELVNGLNRVMEGVSDLIDLLREVPEDALKYRRQLVQELQARFTQLDSLRLNLDFLIAAEWDNYVYWFELPARENSDDCRLYAAPLNISELLYQKLYKKLNTAIFTSATLTVNRSFDYFKSRVGLDYLEAERLHTLLLGAPFDYDEQVLLAIPGYLPDPRSAEFRTALQRILEKLSTEQPRGTLVLFTAYSLLNEMYENLRLSYDSKKIPLLAQGKSGSRHLMISKFREEPRSVLFGTDSFWEGIDVPGEALEILLITKLPFDVPSEPIIQAKAELIEKNGGNPFMDYTIPEAVIKFRQGFGRLIRSRSDCGAVIVADNRILKKMYGRIFLNSLPVKSRIFSSEDELWEGLLHWFESHGVLR